MSQEKMKILEMLQQGTINADDALKLLQELDRLDSTNKKTYDEPRSNGPRPAGEHSGQYENSHHNNNNRGQLNWVNELADTIAETVQSVTGSISSEVWNNKDFDISDTISETVQSITESIPSAIWEAGDFINNRIRTYREHYTSSNVGDFIEALNLKGKNSRVEISSWNENYIGLEVGYCPKSGYDAVPRFEESQGTYSLVYDADSMRSVSIIARIPQVDLALLNVENTNSSISLEDMRATKAELSTKNSSINIENVTGDYLQAKTKNASINLEDVRFNEMKVITSNSKINLENVCSKSAKIVTSNGSINIEDCDIVYTDARTNNGTISITDMADISSSQYPAYTINARTSNSNINIELNGNHSTPMKINASTSLGKIYCPDEDIVFRSRNNNYIDAVSKDYDNAPKKLDMVLQTSNGKIKID